jgi:hypothetical protein
MPASTTCSLPIIANPGNQIFVSAVSLWEIAIKRRLGKLTFEGSAAAIAANGVFELVATPEDAAFGQFNEPAAALRSPDRVIPATLTPEFPPPPGNRRFLLLFFKKEALASLLQANRCVGTKLSKNRVAQADQLYVSACGRHAARSM